MANTHFTKQYNKIVIGGDTLIDLSSDTVAAGSMLSGVTAHDKNGATVTGTIATKTASNVTIATTGTNAGKVTVPAGYYASEVTKAMTNAAITLSDPTITPTRLLLGIAPTRRSRVPRRGPARFPRPLGLRALFLLSAILVPSPSAAPRPLPLNP